jgi:hypothetical protein
VKRELLVIPGQNFLGLLGHSDFQQKLGENHIFGFYYTIELLVDF